VGDPAIKRFDALAGATVARTSAGESIAHKGEVLADEATIQALGADLSLGERRTFSESESVIKFAVVKDFHGVVAARAKKTGADLPPDDELKIWLHDVVYAREQSGQDMMTEFRPCVAMFVRFSGIDYDSEAAGEQLNSLVQLMQARVKRFGGTFFQISIGDKGSYAYINIGALGLHEDDCRRAVKLALALRESAQSLGFIEPLQIGVTQGIMFIGWYGASTRKSFGAQGDDVNLAARLMTTAAPGEILISGRVRKTVADEFTLDARPPLHVKGKTEPIPVYSILGIQQKRSVRLQEPAYGLPMIGRAGELETISQKLALARKGRGQIVGITAEAGMGKSRLAAEGIRLAHRNKLTGYAGACKSDGVNTPYLVWNAVWNAIFDLDPAMPIRKQIRSIELDLEDRAPENLDALPLLGSVLGVPLPENDFTSALQPKDRKSQLETLLVKCLEFSARDAAEDGGGLLLALEDLHWIDPVSSDLLELFAQAIENLPVLILLTYRPPDEGNVHLSMERIKAMGHFTEIKLTDLNAAESEQIIRGKLAQLFPEQRGGVSRLLIERITNRAQGNPFYVEELLNYLHDTGVDLRDTDAWSSLELPTSLHSLILSRIDQLTPSQQLSLKVASVIGRVFRFDHLRDYYPGLGDIEQVKMDLQAMNRLDLTILETPEPELTYIFKHLVTHEVGYESIAYATRAKLHGQYAHYLEESHPDQVESLAPQLALHFEKAQVQDKARHYLIKAGEQAASNFANDEALSYFNRALALASKTTSRFYFDTLLKRERVYDLLGRRPEQRRDLTELNRLADKFEDALNLRAQIAIRQAKLEIDEGDNLAARASALSAIKELASMPGQSPDLLVDALLLEARAMFLSGQAIQSRPQLDDALSQARAHQYLRGEYNALAQLGLWHWYNGDNGSAASLLEQSLELIRQAGDVRRELEILNNLGIVKKDTYQFKDALAHYERAQKIARKIGDRSGESSLLNNMGRASIVSGDFANALLYCSRAEILASDVNDRTVQGIAMHNMSEAYRELGLYVPGRKAADESLKLLRSASYRVGEAYTLENHALIEFSLGESGRALELAEQALTIAREIGAKRVEVSVLTRIGLMKLQMGEIDSAERVFLSAKEIEEEYKEAIPMFELQMGLAEAALARGDAAALTSARPAVDELASQILQDPPADQAHVIPMWLYLTCIRVMRATADTQADRLIRRVHAELLARCEKISDASLHDGFLNIPEHRAIIEFAANLPGSE
jgi:predicted ATPase/class 3 adenylate cyclase